MGLHSGDCVGMDVSEPRAGHVMPACAHGVVIGAPSIVVLAVRAGLALVVLVVAARNRWTALAGSFATGAGLSIAPPLQTRLMDVAHCE